MKRQSFKTNACVSLLALLFVHAPRVAHAEGERGAVREAGVRISMARTTLGGRSIDESPAVRLPIYGVAASVFAHMELFRWNGIGLGIQPELLYSGRGADVELDGAYVGNFRSSYLEAPLLARIEAPMLGPTVFYVVAGPTFNLLLSAKSETGNGTVSDDKEVTSAFDIGLATGVGAAFTLLSRFGLSFEARYEHGFMTIDTNGEADIRNRAVFFTFGISTRFGVDVPPELVE